MLYVPLRKLRTRSLAALTAVILTIGASSCATAPPNSTPNAEPAPEGQVQGETADQDSPETADGTLSIEELSDEEYEAAYLLEPAAQRTINIGYNGGLCQAAIPIAQEKGFFAAEGLTTALTRSDNSRDAIAGGKIDTSAGMIAAWLKPVSNGVDIVFTVGLHTGCASAVVLADSDIQSFEDVKGGVIAISGGIGGTYHNIGYRFVAHDGFSADGFTWKDFSEDQGLLVLEKGEAQVTVLSDQLAEQWVQEGKVRRIRTLTLDDDFRDEACCVLGISGKFLAENPVTSEKISRAIYRASLWIDESEDNKREAAQILLDGGHISGTADYAVDLMNLYRFGIDNDSTEKSLYDSVDEYKALGVLDADADADDLKDRIWHALDLDRLTADSDSSQTDAGAAAEQPAGDDGEAVSPEDVSQEV